MGIKGAFLMHHLCIEGQQFWDLICLDEQRPLDWESVGETRWESVIDGVVIIETKHEFWSAPPISLMVNYTIPKSIDGELAPLFLITFQNLSSVIHKERYV